MSTAASALAASLTGVPDDELFHALALIVSWRPSFHAAVCELAARKPSPRYIGTITHFFHKKQYGFIKCDDVKKAYGLDTFLSNLELGPFAVGSTVSFTLVVNKHGKPQARLLKTSPESVAATPAWPPQPISLRRRAVAMEVPLQSSPVVKIPRMARPSWPSMTE